MRQFENKHSKLQLELDIVETKLKAVTSERDQLKLLLDESSTLKGSYETQNAQLTDRVKDIQELQNKMRSELVSKNEWIAQHSKQIDIKSSVI